MLDIAVSNIDSEEIEQRFEVMSIPIFFDVFLWLVDDRDGNGRTFPRPDWHTPSVRWDKRVGPNIVEFPAPLYQHPVIWSHSKVRTPFERNHRPDIILNDDLFNRRFYDSPRFGIQTEDDVSNRELVVSLEAVGGNGVRLFVVTRKSDALQVRQGLFREPERFHEAHRDADVVHHGVRRLLERVGDDGVGGAVEDELRAVLVEDADDGARDRELRVDERHPAQDVLPVQASVRRKVPDGADDLVPPGEGGAGEIGADEPVGAGDEDLHRSFLVMMTNTPNAEIPKPMIAVNIQRPAQNGVSLLHVVTEKVLFAYFVCPVGETVTVCDCMKSLSTFRSVSHTSFCSISAVKE